MGVRTLPPLRQEFRLTEEFLLTSPKQVQLDVLEASLRVQLGLSGSGLGFQMGVK